MREKPGDDSRSANADKAPGYCGGTSADQPRLDAAAPGLGEEAFRGMLDRLLREIDTLPAGERERLRDAATATRQRHDQLKQTVQKLQETLDFLRLSIKYLVFDLEATRRENAYLRRMLGEARGED